MIQVQKLPRKKKKAFKKMGVKWLKDSCNHFIMISKQPVNNLPKFIPYGETK